MKVSVIIIMILINCVCLLSHNIYKQQLRGMSPGLRQGHRSNSKADKRIHTKVPHRHHVVVGKHVTLLHGKLSGTTHFTNNKLRQIILSNV